MYFHSFQEEEKVAISKQLKNYSLDDCVKDLEKLKTAHANGIEKVAPLSLVGIKFIEHFIHSELLNTKTKQGISFYDFWYNREFYLNRDNSTRNMLEYIQRENPKLNDYARAKKVFNLYYGSVNVFRPTIAIQLYERYKPNCVLDFTMGWGGRLVGACVSKVPKYIGLDSNTNLRAPYEKMREQLLLHASGTDIQLHFMDSREVDYSQLNYDMVFTSPPYYNKELYGNDQTFQTEEEWNTTFYIPLFTKTWESLPCGGVYCLNVPERLYTNICVPLFGESTENIELKKFSRTLPKRDTARKNVGQKYKEQIYVWRKPQKA